MSPGKQEKHDQPQKYFFLHSRIQINVREFRGQGAHCKDVSLIPYLDVFNGVGVEGDGGSCPLFQSFVFFAFLFSSMFFPSLAFFPLLSAPKLITQLILQRAGQVIFKTFLLELMVALRLIQYF